MQIKKELPQFSGKKYLLLVNGRFKFKIFSAFAGEIKLLTEKEIPQRSYSDKEGHFKTREKKVSIIRSGSVREGNENVRHQKMLDKMSTEIKKIMNTEKDIDGVYLYGPEHLIPGLIKALPAKASKIIKKKFLGNYLNNHPYTLLSKIKSYRKTKIVKPMKPEARKIYQKTKKLK